MIENSFTKLFGRHPTGLGNAPGRVNLIGEHIDYNGGMVLPTALPVSLDVAIAPRDDDKINIASDRFDETVERSLRSPLQQDWADYATGAIIFANKAGFLSGGADLYIESTIPDGAGLSSSAALIVAILKAVRDASGSEISDPDVAVLARRVENDFIGVPCGIMDQMAVAVARTGEVIALNTNSLGYDVIGIPENHHMAVVHSGEHRELSDGRYATRKKECDEAKRALNVSELCLLTDNEMEKAQRLPAPLNRRVRHCFTEHLRTISAANALRENDPSAFGCLMNESHLSMRDDFEISTPGIDALVEDAVKFGAHGARLTGGGFGGCIVACVNTDILDNWKEKLLSAHNKAQFVC